MSGDLDFTAEEVVAMMSLAPLASGGWGRDMAVAADAEPTEFVSAYRMLTPDLAGWRSIEVEELWSANMGAPLQIEIRSEQGNSQDLIEVGTGRWVHVLAGCWLRVTPLGDWCLACRIGLPHTEGGPDRALS